MNDLLDWLVPIIQNLLASTLYTLLGLLLGVFVIQRYRTWRDKHKYGRWHVIVTKSGETIVDRQISVRKAKEILDESSDLSVFIKGVVSPYEYLNCDILDGEKHPHLLVQEGENRRFVVNLDKNPPPSNKSRGPAQAVV